MQKLLSCHFLVIIIGLFIAATDMACAQGLPESSLVKPPPVLDSARDIAENSATQSEFEGSYKVGDTTCTVTPVKMAFEIKWAKGQGVMHFFFSKALPDGKTVFVSEDFGKGRDKFIFDDNLYNSGSFIRADGKVFTVERLRVPAKG